MDVLEPCVGSDVIRKGVVYFGPSNNVGPGSVWRTSAQTGYNLRRTLSDAAPNPLEFIKPGTVSACNGTFARVAGIKTSLLLEIPAAGVEAGLSADLDRALQAEVSVTGAAVDLLKEGPFEDFVAELPPAHRFAVDAAKPDRLVLTKAVRVTGLRIRLLFSQEASMALRAKYNNPKLQFGTFGAAFNPIWQQDGSLLLVSDGECYIAGAFSKFSENGFSGAGTNASRPVLVPVPTDQTKSVAFELPDGPGEKR